MEHPGRCFIVLLGMCIAAGCGARPRPVEIDLTAVGGCEVNGRRTILPAVGEPGSRRLVQPDRGSLDMFLRLPHRAELIFSLSPSLPATSFRVSLHAAGEELALVPRAETTGEWRAKIGRFAGEAVRLRLENRSDQVLVWTRPRIVGVEHQIPPALLRDARPADRPINLILYLADALRADHLSVYGYRRATSPRLAQLAQRGVLFLNAYAAGPSTPNSIPSLFASRYPSELGTDLRPRGASRPTLAEAFRAGGYRTAAFMANPLLLEGFGYARGFDHYELVPYHEEPGGTRPSSAAEVHARVLAWLAEHHDRPFFVYVHTMNTHDPYDAPPPFRGMFASEHTPQPIVQAPREKTAEIRRQVAERLLPLPGMREKLDPDRYDEAIAYVDHELGELAEALGTLGMRDRTAIVVTADHGEDLGPEDDGTYLHSHSVFEELVRVPLLIVLPWLGRARQADGPASLLDVAPTLLDLAGLAVPPEFVGRTLFEPYGELHPPSAVGERLEPPWNQGPLTRPGHGTVAEWFVREGPWKMILDPERTWLFHLPSDPKEMNDLGAERPHEVAYLTSVIWQRSPAFAPGGAVPADVGVDAAERKRLNDALRALGYVQ